jgi:hypothetical protein
MTSRWKETTIHSFSRAYLESFTSQELLNVASQLAVDLPQGLSSRTLIIGEILDAVDEKMKPAAAPFQDDGLEPKTAGIGAVQDPKGNPFLTVRIPERYNITYIKALVRDPLWFFVFWEVKSSLLEKLLKMEDFDGLFLRVSALKQGAVFSSYQVAVGNNDKAWYLDFPAEGDAFFVDICALVGGREEPLARTLPFHHPKILAAHETEASQLAVLSGIRVLPILREKTRREDSRRVTNPQGHKQ